MKIAVVGAGNVGGTLAQRIVEADVGDVVLLDIAAGVAQGKGYDLADARPVLGNTCRVQAVTDYAEFAGAAIVVVTAGLARQPGMSREDLLQRNGRIIGQVIDGIKRYAAGAVVVMVTNPLDIMTQFALRRGEFSPRQVVGMGGVLDSARFANLIAETVNVPPAQVQALVIGSHGPGMLPLTRFCTVSGVPLPVLLSQAQQQALAQRTVERGAEIVKLLGSGSAFYAPAAAAFRMVQALARPEPVTDILPACACLNGEYGIRQACIGVPVRLGAGGVREVIELPLTDAEHEQLRAAAASVATAAEQLLAAVA